MSDLAVMLNARNQAGWAVCQFAYGTGNCECCRRQKPPCQAIEKIVEPIIRAAKEELQK